jgi:hypothetical protein
MTYWNDSLYGGIGNTVYIMDVDGSNDFATSVSTGTPITTTVKTSFQFYGGRNAQKHFKMVRPLFYGTGALVPSVNIVTDFKDLTIFGSGDIVLANASLWNSAIWGTSTWSSEATYSQSWLSVTGIGYSAALKMVVTVNRQTCSWQGWDIVFERGGVI